MKAYQDHDPLHGHGKAAPKPKLPTRHTYRGGRFGRPLFVNRDIFQNAKADNYEAHAASGAGLFSAVALIAACLGFRRGR